MYTYFKAFLLMGLMSVVDPFVVANADDSSKEAEKITQLIQHIEQLQDAKFVRNGKEYDAKAAAEFLRSKWRSRKSKTKTTTDFIELVASKSSTSGKPYLIRFKGGKEIKSGDYLLEQLKELEVK